jgi:hypothetical protein
MTLHPIHHSVVQVMQQSIDLMDALMRDKIDLDAYAKELNALKVDDLLGSYQEDFKKDPKMVYYLDALMILSSLQHELDFQVTEYGVNVASEDIRMLKDLLHKFEHKYR